mmetsp:Transcript_53436/g.64414  ORF Transcript_53436/g.64414 Transcript_53436/m.64414 type:complete len:107 (+) Transcript_53436:50-370(+)
MTSLGLNRDTETPYVEDSEEPRSDLGRWPFRLRCYFCGEEDQTVVEHEWDLTTWAWVIAFMFIFFPLSLAPCCVPQMLLTTHRCRHCHRVLGVTRPFVCGGVAPQE